MSNIASLAWLASAICFILSLSGLSQHETARRGNALGIIGIVVAILATLFSGGIDGGHVLLVLALIAGSLGGAFLATRVEMTAMPQMVAILHSFVGLAAVLVGLSVFLSEHAHVLFAEDAHFAASRELIHKIEIFMGIFIGALTFTCLLLLTRAARAMWCMAFRFTGSATSSDVGRT